jgi:hypothetical protein
MRANTRKSCIACRSGASSGISIGHQDDLLWMEAAMADHQPGEQSRSEPRPAGGAGVSKRGATPRPGPWFPLLLFGGLAALSLPLSVLASPRLSTGSEAMLTRVIYPTVTEAMYLGGGFAAGPFPFPLGWYWVGALVSGVLLTAVWCRWQDRRYGTRTPLHVYLIAGLALAAVTAALPLLAWGMPVVPIDASSMRAWTWLDTLWRQGTFALLAIAVSLGILARIRHSRAMAVSTAIYTAAVGLTGWLNLQQAPIGPAFYPFGDPTVLLPAAVLLLAGLATMLTAGLRERRARIPRAGITAKIVN